MQCIFCKAAFMTFLQHISRADQSGNAQVWKYIMKAVSGVEKHTAYLGANDDLPISWDKERAECILTVHCPDALQGRSGDKGKAQNLLSHTQSDPLRHAPRWPLPRAVFSAGARRYTTTMLWPKCYPTSLRTFSIKTCRYTVHHHDFLLLWARTAPVIQERKKKYDSMLKGNRAWNPQHSGNTGTTL